MSAVGVGRLVSCGVELDSSAGAFGWLRDSTDLVGDGLALRGRLEADGYLYLKGVLPVEAVGEVRGQALALVGAQGVLDEGDRMKAGAEMGAFQPELVTGNVAMQRVVFGAEMEALMASVLEASVTHYRYVWFRTVGPGKGTAPHCDVVYMGRGTFDVLTCWVPFGEVDTSLGGLMVLEGSHRRRDLTGEYLAADVDSYCENGPGAEKVRSGELGWEHYQRPGEAWDGSLSHDPRELQRQFGGRWLTSPRFEMGDVLVFTMGTVHASLDNQTDRVRMSADVRWQREGEAMDERYAGDSPIAHGMEAKRGRIC